jgi:hypothetical protein
MKQTYTWKGVEEKVVKACPLHAQAYLALLNPEDIKDRVWMKEQSGKRIKEFKDLAGYDSFRFDLQTKSKRRDGYYYCIQMQSNRESRNYAVPGKPNSYSYCDVQIHSEASPSPTMFLDACWSSAAQCNNITKEGDKKPKTMTVVIYANNTWRNLETGEEGCDEEAKAEAKTKELGVKDKEIGDILGKVERGTANKDDYDRLLTLKGKK